MPVSSPKIKKEPTRLCVATRQNLPKHCLLRVVRDKGNKITLDLTGKLPGRGVYIQATKDALVKARVTRALDRALKADVPADVYESLEPFCK